jgi:hypothetical protein
MADRFKSGDAAELRADRFVLYREFALSGIWPRSCPEYIPDSVVTEKLRECARTERLPWSLDDDDDLE